MTYAARFIVLLAIAMASIAIVVNLPKHERQSPQLRCEVVEP